MDTKLYTIQEKRICRSHIENYCFLYDNRQFELDLFPLSDEYAILEIEVRDIDEKIVLPALDIVKEVTDDPRYKNHHIAKIMKLEA